MIEAAAADAFPRFMTRKVFEPVGMESTVFDEADGVPGRASFYFPRMAMRIEPREPTDSRRSELPISPLDHVIGVQIPASQPNASPSRIMGCARSPVWAAKVQASVSASRLQDIPKKPGLGRASE